MNDPIRCDVCGFEQLPGEEFYGGVCDDCSWQGNIEEDEERNEPN